LLITTINRSLSVSIVSLSREDIAKIIDGLKNKMTYGPDGLPVAIIKRVKIEVAEPLSILINRPLNLTIVRKS